MCVAFCWTTLTFLRHVQALSRKGALSRKVSTRAWNTAARAATLLFLTHLSLICFVVGVVVSAFIVGEYTLLRLRYLLRLRELQLQRNLPYDLHVSFIFSKDFGDHLRRMHEGEPDEASEIRAAEDEAAEAKPATASRKRNREEEHAIWRPLIFSADPAASSATRRILFRHCKSVPEMASGAPIHAINYCALMLTDHARWTPLQQAHALSQLRSWISTAQGRQQPIIVPPASWDEEVEQKVDVYEKFKEVMVPTQWIKVPEIAHNFLCEEEEVKELFEQHSNQTELIAAWKVLRAKKSFLFDEEQCKLALKAADEVILRLLHGAADGFYYVKGRQTSSLEPALRALPQRSLNAASSCC